MTTTEQYIPNINEELLELLNRTDEEILQRLQQQKDQETDEQKFAVDETRTQIKKLIAEYKQIVEKLNLNNIDFQRYVAAGKSNLQAAPKYIYTYMINKHTAKIQKKFKSAKSANSYNLRFFLIDTHNDTRHNHTYGQPVSMLANFQSIAENLIKNNVGFNQEIDQLVSLQLLIQFLQKTDKEQANSRLYFKFENYQFMLNIIQKSRYRALLEREFQLMNQILLYCFIKDIILMAGNQSTTNNFTINPTFLIYSYFLRLAEDQSQSITQDVTTLTFMFLNQYLKDIPVRINYILNDSIHNRENYLYCLYRAFELASNLNKKFMDVGIYLQPFVTSQTSAEFVQAKYIVSKFFIEQEYQKHQNMPLHVVFDKIIQSRISYLQSSFALQVKSTTNAKRFIEEQNTYVRIARSAKYSLSVYRYYDTPKNLVYDFNIPENTELHQHAMITPTITYFQLYKIYEVFTQKVQTGPSKPTTETFIPDDKFYTTLDPDYHNLFLSAKMDYVYTIANVYIVTDLGFLPLYVLPFSDQTVYYSGIDQILSYNQQARQNETIENYIQQAQLQLVEFIQDFNDIQMAIYTQFGETTITKQIDDPQFQIDSTYRCLQLIRSLYALRCICDFYIQKTFITDVIIQLQQANNSYQINQEEMNQYSSQIEKPQPQDFQIEVETVRTRNKGFILQDQADIQRIERKLVEFDTESIYQQHQDYTIRLFSLDQDIYFIFQILIFSFQQSKIIDKYQINTLSPFLFDKDVIVIFDQYFDVFKEQVQISVATDDLRLQYHIQKKKISFYISKYGQDVLSDILTNQKFFKMKKQLRKLEGRQELVEEQLIQLREVQEQYTPQVIEQTLEDIQNMNRHFEIKVRTEYETQVRNVYDKIDGIISKIQTERQKMTQFQNYTFNGSFPYGGYGQVVKDMYTTVKQAEQLLQLPDLSKYTEEALEALNKTLVTVVEEDTKFRGVLTQQIEQLKIETTAELKNNPIRNRYWAQKFVELRKISLQVVSQINNTVELFGQKSDLSKISSFNAYQVLADKFIQDQLHEKQKAEEKASRQKNFLTPMNKLAMISQQTDQPPVWKPSINELQQDEFRKRFLQPGLDPALAQQLKDQYFITIKADKQTVAEAQQIIFDNLMARRFMGEANKQLSQLGNYVKAVIQEDEVD